MTNVEMENAVSEASKLLKSETIETGWNVASTGTIYLKVWQFPRKKETHCPSVELRVADHDASGFRQKMPCVFLDEFGCDFTAQDLVQKVAAALK